MPNPIKSQPAVAQANAPLSNHTDKKLWVNPGLIFISANDVNAKIHPSVHEGTGHPGATIGLSSYFRSQNNSHTFKGTSKEAIS